MRAECGLKGSGSLSQGDVRHLLAAERRRQIADDTYEKIEQGRVMPGKVLLEDIMLVLRLSNVEREYVYQLANRAVPPRIPDGTATVSPAVKDYLEKLAPWPAYVRDPLWFMVGFNRAALATFTSLRTLPPEDRNIVWLMMTDAGKQLRAQLRDSETHARWIVARFRRSHGLYLGSQRFDAFVERLRKASPRFVDLWDQNHNVGDDGETDKDVADPREAYDQWPTTDRLLKFQMSSWHMQGTNDLTLMVFQPRDAATQRALEELAD
jgi:hypothetical protein